MIALALVFQAAAATPTIGAQQSDVGPGAGPDGNHLTAMGAEGIARGNDRLMHGQFGLAVNRFRVELMADPESIPANRGLALSLAGQRKCAAAFPVLGWLRAHAEVDVALSVAEGNCALRTGSTSLAIAAFEEAILLDPTDAEAWYGLASAREETREWDAFDDAIEHLKELEWKHARAPVMAATALAWALRPFGGDAAWQALRDLRETIARYPGDARAASVEANTIEGELWLDLGDPIAAENAFAQGTARAIRAPRVGALLAEANRRQGLIDEAERLLTEGRARRGEHVAKDTIRARVLIDQGRFDDAEAEFASLSHDHLEVEATRWYLARARADARGMALAEASWRDLGPAPEATLDQLVPWSR